MSSRFASGRRVRNCWESVFHVLSFEVLPTPIFTIIFSQAPQNERDLPLIAQNNRNSILRKRVYSFKHSGNSRGEHRGLEKVCSDWRSGLKMRDILSGCR